MFLKYDYIYIYAKVMWLMATIDQNTYVFLSRYIMYIVCVLYLYYCKYIDLKFPTNKIKISLNCNVKIMAK